MALKRSLSKIKHFILNRYKDNLAGILVFGSANTGHFLEGKSDIDTMIFLKKLKDLNLDDERKFLIDSLKSENFHTQYFFTLERIKKYVSERISWSTRITILAKDGSIALYSTPSFEKLKKWLLESFPSKNEIKKYVLEKDNVELYGYFKDLKDFWLTKGLMAHIRRKLQVMNYFKTNKLIFDYLKCLNNLEFSESERKKFEKLYNIYFMREELSNEEVREYLSLAKKLTKKILKM